MLSQVHICIPFSSKFEIKTDHCLISKRRLAFVEGTRRARGIGEIRSALEPARAARGGGGGEG